jgi:Flp pilus assembly protein TadG
MALAIQFGESVMSGKPFFNRARIAVRRFLGATQGNIAVLFAITCVPIISFVGLAVDYSRANSARTSMQSALDSTALMVAKDLTSGTITAEQIDAKAKTYFAALYTSKDAKLVTVKASYTAGTDSNPSTVQVDGAGMIDTDFLMLAGFPTIKFNTSSTSTWGDVKMRVALALDNTASMSRSGKITALRNAVAGSGGLIDQLSALSKTNGDVYISVVPFAKIVNVDRVNSNQNWIDWTDWLNPPTAQPNNGSTQASLPMNWHAVGPGAICPWTASDGGFGCVSDPNGLFNSQAIPSAGTYAGYICPGTDSNSHTNYNGCWVSTPAGSGVFCSGSSSCKCPTNMSGSAVAECSCSGHGNNKSCTGNLYTHDWTQPGPNDLVHNPTQPRVNAAVGFTNNRWTPATSTPTVANDWREASTHPISGWTGCVTDRTQPNDTTGVLPASDVATLFPANEYYDCGGSWSPPLRPIIALNSDWTSLKSAVNAMKPNGTTNQAIGLAWAWQSLLPRGPLKAPAEDTNTTYNRVIILLSDGLNTENRWPDHGDGRTQAQGNPIDARQASLCQNLKNVRDSRGRPMYTIYTIQVNTDQPADPTSSVLQNCASTPDKFYMLTNSSQIATTFYEIGTALSKLRVAR